VTLRPQAHKLCAHIVCMGMQCCIQTNFVSTMMNSCSCWRSSTSV
jgi:hypothetical protein